MQRKKKKKKNYDRSLKERSEKRKAAIDHRLFWGRWPSRPPTLRNLQKIPQKFNPNQSPIQSNPILLIDFRFSGGKFLCKLLPNYLFNRLAYIYTFQCREFIVLWFQRWPLSPLKRGWSVADCPAALFQYSYFMSTEYCYRYGYFISSWPMCVVYL